MGTRYVGVMWLLFLIRPLDLINMWFSEDRRAKYHKDTCLEEIGLHLQIMIIKYLTLNNEHNWGGLMYPIKKLTNMHF